MFTPFHYAFVQRGVVEVALLSIAVGLVGTWIVLRGLAFYCHAVATATFPGLVLADGLGFPAPLGAFGATVVFALGVQGAGRVSRASYDSVTALVLTGSLAAGVILASDVFHSGAGVEALLFGSLLAIGTHQLVLAAAVSTVVAAASSVLGRSWLAAGFEQSDARTLGLRSRVPDLALLALVALSVTAALSAVGALLATALLVTPAATVRLVTTRVLTLQLGAVAVAAAEGVAGLWLSVEVNVPPGAAIAVLAGAVFSVVALARVVRSAPRRRLALPLAGAALALVVLAGCGSSSSAGSGRLDVVATTTQIGDWTRIVGGNAVSVHQILQPNTDPHEYEPRPADVEKTAAAKLVFENGDGLDAWMQKVVSTSGGSPTVIDLGKAVPVHVPGQTSGSEASRFDPHWWHDPRNAAVAVERIRAAFAAADRHRAGAFTRRADAYVRRIRALDRAIAACFARVPTADRKLVTNHDAFNYFAKRYRIRVVGAIIPSQTTQAQPSAGETARLIAQVRREHVRAIFPESSLNPRLARAIARATGASAAFTLYGDTLGPHGSTGTTYLAMETANADAMVRGFTGGQEQCRIGNP